jgi:PIN domain nuclease of toxin-antitoxin system
MGQSQVILLDTHVVLWLATDPAKLSGKAKLAIQDTPKNGDGLAVSGITLLELATLASKGRIHLDISIESFLEEVEARFVVLPKSGRVCARATELPLGYPNDPAGRIIGATALVEGLSLLTADREIRQLKALRTVWQSLRRVSVCTSRVLKYKSIRLSMVASRSTIAIPGFSI